jgi:hypothetical protein
MFGLEPLTPITRKRLKEPTFDHDLSPPRALPYKLAPTFRAENRHL